MAEMKLELVLIGKDLLAKILSKDIGFLKQFKREGEGAAKSADKLDAARRKSAGSGAVAADGAKKTSAALKAEASDAERAARAEEKLNNARKRGANGRLRDGQGRYVSDGTASGASGKSPGRRRAGGSESPLEEDLMQGGAGATGLWLSKKGLGAAMSKQEALTDLNSAFYRSSMSATALNQQMAEGERIADRLGSKLPGNTADYLNMFSVMKQRGIEANVILAGAGEAAALLAVANKEDRQDVGKNVARFGQMFNLKTRDEYIGAADLMSRAKTTYGIQSDELMEAVKDFSGRTGKGLGLDGGRGAEDTLRYLSFLRAKTGMEGLTVGTAASSFFQQYLQAKQKKKDPTEELKKLTGVDLKIFDDKGKFLGLENAVKEFSKLKGKLSDEKMLDFGNQLAGQEGASVFQAMVKNGDQFGQFNQELTQSISLQEKSAKNAENLSNKIEALTGSLENLGAAGFKPLVPVLSGAADKANSAVGTLTDLAKAYPTTAGTTAGVLALGSAILTLKGGTGVVSRFMNSAGSDILAVDDKADKATKKVGRFRGALNSLSVGNMIKIGLAVETIGFTWEQIEKLRELTAQQQKTNKNMESVGKSAGTGFAGKLDSIRNQGETPKRAVYNEEANWTLNSLQQGANKNLEYALAPEREPFYRKFVQDLNPFNNQPDVPKGSMVNPEKERRMKEVAQFPQEQKSRLGINSFNLAQYVTREMSAVKAFQRNGQVLNNPDVMASFRNQAPSSLNLNETMKAQLEQWLKQAFPSSFEASSGILEQVKQQQMQAFADYANKINESAAQYQAQQTQAQQAQLMALSDYNTKVGETGVQFQVKGTEVTDAMGGIKQPAFDLTGNFSGMNQTAMPLPGAFSSASSAATNFATRVNTLEIKPPTFAPIQIPTVAAPNGQQPPGRARGGGVQKGRPYMVGEIGKELFVPEASGTIIPNDRLRRKSKPPGRARGGAVQKGKPYVVGEVGTEMFVPALRNTQIPNDRSRRRRDPRETGGILFSDSTPSKQNPLAPPVNIVSSFQKRHDDPSEAKSGLSEKFSQAAASNQNIARIENELYSPTNSIVRNESRSNAPNSARPQPGNFNVTFQIYGADDPQTTARVVEQKLRKFKAEIEADLQADAVARRVAYAAERDYERT